MSHEPRSAPGPRWVVYATWDAVGAAAPYVVEQLAAYRECGFETLVVDASPWRSPAREDDWERVSSVWRPRANLGYDFGSYLYGLTVLSDEFGISIDRLSVLLTNDSCYGPYTPMAEVFARFAAREMPEQAVFGITESNEIARHLQSYWLYFPAGVAVHALRFLQALPGISTRDEAIQHGEVGLSQYLLRQHCSLVVWSASAELVRRYSRFNGSWWSLAVLGLRWMLKRYRYTRRGDRACLKSRLGRPYEFNPMLDFGTHMHIDALTPFIKRALLRDNPSRDPLVPTFEQGVPVDNLEAASALRSTDAYRRRYRRPWAPVGRDRASL